MDNLWNGIAGILTYDKAMALIRALLVIIAGYAVAKLAGVGVKRLFRERLETSRLRIFHRSIYYTIFLLFIISGLKELGFNLSVMLGAAGILSVALGFAAQTSVSNLISGLFLIGERPFSVGDNIQVGDKIGEVFAIDMLSVKLRTFDNLFVRIPNETMIKTDVITLTKFPERRVDLKIGVAYEEDLAAVRQVLLEVAENNPLCLKEPEPVCNVLGFGDSGIDLLFGVWVETENFLALKNSVQMEVKLAFDEKGIEIPFPHLTLSPGRPAEPLSVDIVRAELESPAAA
ncbi:MAG: mechanosensitive ion channel family protein [Fidelibacterota bacterium]|nr:MAG: mechanosensitive ion channel family protein [Candidatus Neomarinimicrobiota bacterium]